MRHYALIALLVLTLLVGCGPELAAQPQAGPAPTAIPTRLPYEAADLRKVEQRDLLDALTGRATVVPKQTDQLAFRSDGRIDRVEVSAGDTVTKGQVIARLEQTDLEYQIQLARIDLELAQLREQDARAKKAPQTDLDIATKEVERAQVAVKRLEAAQQSLLVTAPYAGRVSDLAAKPGAQITAYTPIATIVGTEELIVQAEFDGPKAGRVTDGLNVELRSLDGGAPFQGAVAGKAGGDNPNAWLVVPAAGSPHLTLGDTLRVTAVFGRAAGALTLPVDAIKTIGDRHYVLLVDKGDLRRVYVETGFETDGIVEIKSGLQVGQQVSER
jgi:macrolide-specific efflux system membrane fusion protein